MSETAIKVENLSKKYLLGSAASGNLRDTLAQGWNQLRGKESKSSNKEFWALKDVSFEVKKGEVVGVIGRNGAGKSTLLKILSRITEPTSGRIELNGRVASLLEVGTGFHPELSGRENIFLNGALLGMTRAEIKRKFDEIIDFSGVEEFIDTPVKKYSSGMYVRLAFAVAAHLEPEILLVDEVLAVGDAEFQKKCLGKMDEVAKGGRTVIFVSHNMGAVRQLCQKTVTLEKGRKKFFGISQEAIQNYIHISEEKRNLINHVKYFNTNIKVHQIFVNQQPFDQIEISGDSKPILISFKIETFEQVKISVNAILHDSLDNQIGIYSPGHENFDNQVFKLNSGKHSIDSTIMLPRLNKGIYSLSFSLVYPGVEGYVNFKNALQIFHLGTLCKTGFAFEQGKNGYLFLDGFIKVC